MAVKTQEAIALQMLSQFRVFDPSASGEIGTPERKILDTVAEALAESQIDLNLLGGALDLSSKFGSDLDSFLALFGFGRQQGAFATGFVTFGRPTASSYNIIIPRGTQVLGSVNITVAGTTETTPLNVTFQTTDAVTLIAGQTSVIAPIQALVAGKQGNLAANTITQFANLGAPPLGITTVTNQVPTTNGADPETDAEFKVRFKNTVFRNVAGTEDQFLALAVATQFTTKAIVVGPVSRYREYIQVPAQDDNNDVNPAVGTAWTSALSDIPYAKYIYANLPYFISNGSSGVDAIFYRQDTDFVLNSPPLNTGDAAREYAGGVGPNPTNSPNTPNVTFSNIYTGADNTVQLIRSSDVVLLEYSYQSTATRNDVTRNISNCVDVYINNSNPTTASAILPPVPGSVNLFSSNPTNKYYNQNYRRIGEPDHLPVVGHAFTALFWQPVLDVPSQIVVGTNTYLKNTHYWGVQDVSAIGNTIRARNGIEWAIALPGMTGADAEAGPYSGQTITGVANSNITVTGYIYDRNVIDIQAALDGSKQTTTDVLAHTGTTRYFKLDITVMYSPGASIQGTNAQIADAVGAFFDGQYFGSVIQLSDLLQVIHNVQGVDNVRWSKEVLQAQAGSPATDSKGGSRDRVTECDANGRPRTGVILDRIIPGSTLVQEQWSASVVGGPTGGTYTLSQGSPTTASIALTDSAATIQSKLSTAGIAATVTGTATSFTITFSGTGYQTIPLTSTSLLTGGTSVFNSDFFLRDNELPALPTNQLTTDILPGLVIRTRAQNNWSLL